MPWTATSPARQGTMICHWICYLGAPVLGDRSALQGTGEVRHHSSPHTTREKESGLSLRRGWGVALLILRVLRLAPPPKRGDEEEMRATMLKPWANGRSASFFNKEGGLRSVENILAGRAVVRYPCRTSFVSVVPNPLALRCFHRPKTVRNEVISCVGVHP